MFYSKFLLKRVYTHNYTGLFNDVSVHFTLHTEPRTSPPEFTISCRTHGGPATTVKWTHVTLDTELNQDSDHEISQLILNTTQNAVYDNRLRVRGRRSGEYACIIVNDVKRYLPNATNKFETSEFITGTYIKDKQALSVIKLFFSCK